MLTRKTMKLLIVLGAVFISGPLFFYGTMVYPKHGYRTGCYNDKSTAGGPSLRDKAKPGADMELQGLLNNQISYNSLEKQLVPGLVASQVIYLWCRNSWFEFKHYLSVRSVIRTLNPQRVVFYYKHPVKPHKNQYFQWMDDLMHDHPFFIYEQMPATLVPLCTADQETKVRMIMKLLDKEGGIYMSENSWIYDLRPEVLLKNDLVYALEPDNIDGFVMLRGGILKNNNYKTILQNKRFKTKKMECVNVKDAKSIPLQGHCVTVQGRGINSVKPSHIWDLNTPFGKLARKIHYGTEQMPRPKPSFDTLVPNIGHMIWFGGGNMDFLFYLSALSLLYVVKVDTLYIHGDKEPRGDNWPKLKKIKNVKFVTTLRPLRIYQGGVEMWKTALLSDFVRVDLMVKYGGIYTDTDALWVKPLTLQDRGYDAVASYDWVDWYRPYPDTVNFGVSYGKRNAPFWRIFQESMRTLHNDIRGFTGVMNPYKLMERYPDLLRIDKRLQVICYRGRCHPLWDPDYHNMTKDHVSMNSIPNWREDVYAFHWTHPNPPEYKNISTLIAGKGMFADIGRFILKKAGLI